MNSCENWSDDFMEARIEMVTRFENEADRQNEMD